MQTVKDIQQLDTCTSPQFLHKLQTFQMNTAIYTTLKSLGVVFETRMVTMSFHE